MLVYLLVVGFGYGSEVLLTSSIPELDFNFGVINFLFQRNKIDTQSAFGVSEESLVCVSVEEVRLSDPRISNKDNFYGCIDIVKVHFILIGLIKS
jgi:hypothetical protein